MRSSVASGSESTLPLRRFTRRGFGKLATALTAGAALPIWDEPALAQMSRLQTIPPGAIRINANENPLGPSPEAADAIHNIVKNGGRYMYDLTDALAREMAEGLGVKYSANPDESYIRIFAGSSAPLHQAVFA